MPNLSVHSGDQTQGFTIVREVFYQTHLVSSLLHMPGKMAHASYLSTVEEGAKTFEASLSYSENVSHPTSHDSLY